MTLKFACGTPSMTTLLGAALVTMQRRNFIALNAQSVPSFSATAMANSLPVEGEFGQVGDGGGDRGDGHREREGQRLADEPTLSASMLCSTVCGTVKVGVKLVIGDDRLVAELDLEPGVHESGMACLLFELEGEGDAVDCAGVVDGDEHLDDPLRTGRC